MLTNVTRNPNYQNDHIRENISIFPKVNTPIEILDSIFSRFSCKELFELKTVCKNWKKYCAKNPNLVLKMKTASNCLTLAKEIGEANAAPYGHLDDLYKCYFLQSCTEGNIFGVINSMERFLNASPSGATIGSQSKPFLEQFIGYWSKKDYQQTKCGILSIKDGDYKNHLIYIFLFCNFSIIDLDEMLSLFPFSGRNCYQRISLIDGMIRKAFYKRESLEKIKFLINLHQEGDRDRWLRKLVEIELASGRNEEAKKIAQLITPQGNKFEIDLEIIKADAKINLKSTKINVQSLEDSTFKDQAFMMIIEVERLTDLYESKKTAEFIKDPSLKNSAFAKIIEIEASISIAEAKETFDLITISRIFGNRSRNLALLCIAKNEFEKNPIDAQNTVNLIEDKDIKFLALLLMVDPTSEVALNTYNYLTAGYCCFKTNEHLNLLR